MHVEGSRCTGPVQRQDGKWLAYVSGLPLMRPDYSNRVFRDEADADRAVHAEVQSRFQAACLQLHLVPDHAYNACERYLDRARQCETPQGAAHWIRVFWEVASVPVRRG